MKLLLTNNRQFAYLFQYSNVFMTFIDHFELQKQSVK